MELLLQWLGGGFYLLNKIFFSFSERALNRGRCSGDMIRARRWRIASWIAYLAGLPPWVIIFVHWRNWIAASVEAAGAPLMAFGLVTAIRMGTPKQAPRWLDALCKLCILAGFTVSMLDFGGLRTMSQWLEVGLVTGYLVGTYQLARLNATGYLWFVLMHVTCGWLMWIQGFPWLFVQQLVSLLFIGDAYLMARRTAHELKLVRRPARRAKRRFGTNGRGG